MSTGKAIRWGIVPVVAAFVLALLPMAAMAEDVPTFQPSEVKIVKVIKGSPEAPVAGDQFGFTITGLGYEDANGNLIAGTTAPMINSVTSPAAIAMNATSTETNVISDNHQTQTITFANIDWPKNFPHAGVYEYRVVESGVTDGTVNVNGHHYNASVNAYLMRIYVVNDAASSSAGTGLKIQAVTLEDTDDGQKVDQMEFTNRYDQNAALTITKKVTGDYGDKSKHFTFSVKLIVPESEMASITTTKDGVGAESATVPAVNAHGMKTGASGTPSDRHFLFGYSKAKGAADSTAVKLEGQPNVAIITGIELADGDTLSFDAVLPVGTRYEIVETGETGYTASAVTYNSTTQSDATKTDPQPSAGTTGADYTIAAGKNTAVTVNGASAVITNDYKTITPTGVFMDNLPYILMIGIPVIALIAWALVQRRRRMMA